jgi:quinol monooxygenase YgiN
MYGLIGKMMTVDGKRDELTALLLQAVTRMPGCLSYVVAEDAADANAIWITEVWDTQESHDQSLTLPEVRAMIATARPLIAGFEKGVTTKPLGGHGLVPSQR